MIASETKIFIYAVVFFAVIGFSAVAEELPGDNFRQAAEEHDHEAATAVDRAAAAEGETIGRYMQLAAVFREMARIKRRAGSLADVDRWDKISWEEYGALEQERDVLLDALDRTDGDSRLPGEPSGGGDQGAAAYRRYASEARSEALGAKGAEQAIYRELAEVFSEMAAIKDAGTDAERDGPDGNRSRYAELSDRRRKLERMLEVGR